MMLTAVLIIACVMLVVIAAGILTLRTALEVIHVAVNSNMTRALDEITQLHKDVTLLIKERNQARVASARRQGEEELAGRVVVVLDDIAEAQKEVATDLADSRDVADEKAAEPDTVPGEIADASAQTPKKKENE